MGSKTCRECKYHDKYSCLQLKNIVYISPTHLACIRFCPKNPTNGDCIRQGGDDALIDFADGIRRKMCHYCAFFTDKSCVDKTGDCWEGVKAWLNAPAESEVNNG